MWKELRCIFAPIQHFNENTTQTCLTFLTSAKIVSPKMKCGRHIQYQNVAQIPKNFLCFYMSSAFHFEDRQSSRRTRFTYIPMYITYLRKYVITYLVQKHMLGVGQGFGYNHTLFWCQWLLMDENYFPGWSLNMGSTCLEHKPGQHRQNPGQKRSHFSMMLHMQ